MFAWSNSKYGLILLQIVFTSLLHYIRFPAFLAVIIQLFKKSIQDKKKQKIVPLISFSFDNPVNYQHFSDERSNVKMKENITLAFASASTLGKRVFRSVKFLAVDQWIDLHFQKKTAALISEIRLISILNVK